MRADFASQAYLRNPAAEIEKLRSTGPVVKVRFPMVGNVWTTTTQDTADRVLKDSDTFTIRNSIGGVAGLQWWMPGIVRTLANHMLSKDEPDHKRLRDIVDEAFRRRAVLEMEPRILSLADELADELFAEGSPADLVERYARKLPLSVICELLAEIDEKVKAFLSRPIEGDWPYLWVDATYVKMRQNRRIVPVAVIVGVGVNGDGRREILGMHIGPTEAETFWTAFLRKLARRGLPASNS